MILRKTEGQCVCGRTISLDVEGKPYKIIDVEQDNEGTETKNFGMGILGKPTKVGCGKRFDCGSLKDHYVCGIDGLCGECKDADNHPPIKCNHCGGEMQYKKSEGILIPVGDEDEDKDSTEKKQ